MPLLPFLNHFNINSKCLLTHINYPTNTLNKLPLNLTSKTTVTQNFLKLTIIMYNIFFIFLFPEMLNLIHTANKPWSGGAEPDNTLVENTILDSEELNDIDPQTDFFSGSIDNLHPISLDFALRNGELVQHMTKLFDAQWHVFRNSAFYKTYPAKKEDLDKRISSGAVFRPKQEHKELFQKYKSMNPIPSLGMSIGHSYIVQYPGKGKSFTIGKFWRKRSLDKNADKQPADCFSQSLPIKAIPSLVLSLSALYHHLLDKLEHEGKEKNLNTEHPQVHILSRPDTLGDEFLKDINK